MEIITKTKVKLIEWLCGEELILQHVRAQNLITTTEYMKVKSIRDPTEKIIELLDLIMKKGESRCIAFLELLKRDDVNESRPGLREWITAINTSGAYVSEEEKNRAPGDKNLSFPQPNQNNTLKLEQYGMKGDWRGFALIINNYDFSQCPDLNNREGTDIDEKSLAAVFKWLGFETVIKQDCNKDCMLSALDELRSRDHTQADCVVCCVLTHGFGGGLYGVDGGEVLLKELMERLNGHHCPSLKEKPKLFFIQACQGNQHQQVVFLQPDSSNSTSDMETGLFCDTEEPRKTIPAEANYLLAKATVPGYVSYREKFKGTWFIQSLCQNLQKLVPSGIDLLSILTKVNNEVSQKADRSGTRKQMPQPEYTLTKRVVFPVPKTPMPF
ncbi:caspase-8-like [Neoarius graeffei]|uniref:caspase-8-like n=1 Tax=Neoarius graeffei TaxID=443677 RepID=UPI00298CAC76|nr:caspase-8-like [Neoarius graeffei]